MRRTTALSAILASTVLSGVLATPALAQLVAPAPVRQSVDANGVDLFMGTLNVDGPAISIGQGEPQGFSYKQVYRGFGWSDNVIATLDQNGSTVAVALGGTSDRFTVSGSSFLSTENKGSSLTLAGTIYTYQRADGTIVRFDSSRATGAPFYASLGRVIDMTTPSGLKLVYTYESANYCARTKYLSSGPICTQQGTTWRLKSVRNSYGYQLTYTLPPLPDGYDSTDPNSQSQITNWSTPTAATLSNLASGGGSASESFGYYSSGNDSGVQITDNAGSSSKYQMSNGVVVGIVKPGGSQAATIGYNGARVSSVTTAVGTWQYAASDNGSTRTVTVTDPTSQTTTYLFDIGLQRMTQMTDPKTNVTHWDWDASGRLLKATAPEGNAVSYVYDGHGNATETHFVPKAGSGQSEAIARAAYPCADGVTCAEPSSTTDTGGNTTDYTYDHTHGGVLTVSSPAATSGAARATVVNGYTPMSSFTGDTVYKLTSSSTCRTAATCDGSPNQTVTSTDYGPQGTGGNLLPQSVTVRAGDNSVSATTGYAYDGIGNVVQVDGPLVGSADTVFYRYDANRVRIGTISPQPQGASGSNRPAMRLSYNPDGSYAKQELGVVAGTDDGSWSNFSSRQQIESTFDPAGRPTSSKLSANGTAYSFSQSSYNAAARTSCTAVRMNAGAFGAQGDACSAGTQGADGPDRITLTHADEDGRTDYVTSGYGTAAAATERMAYTRNGKTQSVTDANNNTTSYGLDGFDRLSTTTYPGGSFEQLTYDAGGTGIGNVTSRRLRDGQVLTYDYDALGHRTFDHNPKTNIAEVDVAYGYDLLGHLVTTNDGNGWTKTFGYDALGRAMSQGSNVSNTTLQYDAAGRMTRQTWGDGFFVTYEYDAAGDMTVIRENGGFALASFGYNDLGRRSSLTRGNGVTTSYNYDAAGRLGNLSFGGAQPNSYGYGYNSAGQITSRTSSNDAYAWTGAASVDRSYGVNVLNQYTSAGATNFGYDGRGNLTNSGNDTYQYNTRNQLFMNGSGQLIYRNPAGELGQTPGVNYDWVNGQLAQESGSSVIRRWVYGPGTDEPLVWYEGAGTNDRRYMVADERGSVVAVTDAGGNAIAINTYDEHGIPGNSGVYGRFGYTGQIWVSELGMYDYKARMYSPTLGRFMQPDPIGYGDGLNWYGYAHGDPVNGSDPSGTLSSNVFVYGPGPGGGGGTGFNLGLIPGISFSGGNSFGPPHDDDDPSRTVVVNATKSKPKPVAGTLPGIQISSPQVYRDADKSCQKAVQLNGPVIAQSLNASFIAGAGGQVSKGTFSSDNSGVVIDGLQRVVYVTGRFTTVGAGLGLDVGPSATLFNSYNSMSNFTGMSFGFSGTWGVASLAVSLSSSGSVTGGSAGVSPPSKAFSATASRTQIYDCHYSVF